MKGADEIDSKWTTPVLDIITFYTYHSFVLKIFIPNQVALASYFYMLIGLLKKTLLITYSDKMNRTLRLVTASNSTYLLNYYCFF